MRIAAIDIGTNSVRSTIVDVPVDGARSTLDDEKAYTRLGRGTTTTGKLSEQSINDTIAALRRMLRIANRHDVTHVRAVATAAVRDASNAEVLLDRAFEELNLDIEVISEQEEGRLAFLSAVENVRVEGEWALVDIGGGSVEIVRATDQQVRSIASLPLGAVVMTERFLTEDPIPKREYKKLVKHVRGALGEAVGEDPVEGLTLVGSGGTVGAVAALIATRTEPGYTSLHRFELRRDDVTEMLAMLARMSAEERAAVKGLPESRIDIIVAGAVVLDECMRVFGADSILYNARGIREGIVLDTIDRERGLAMSRDRMQAVRDFGRKYHADVPHAEQVRALSLRLFDGLPKPLKLEPGDRPLLEAAALMHDVGYHIAYERHHKHSYHLISYASLPGFNPKEMLLIAAIARYHTGAMPKSGHDTLRDFSRQERDTVSRIAAILRLADGLDRSRAQHVTSLEIEPCPLGVVLKLHGDSPVDVEVHGGQQKADLFESVFGLRVDVIAASDAG